MNKRKTIYVGGVPIGGGNPIIIQSMTNTFTYDVEKTVEQIKKLEEAGCEIVRVAVPDMESAKAIGKIKKRISIPLIADIHFDHKLALASIDEGVDGLRLNPGNIKKREFVEEVVRKAKERKIPIRIGVNAGSIDRNKYKFATAEAIVDSALSHIKILEDMDFYDIKVSLKSYDIKTTVESYRLFAQKRDYPLHVGITEAGDLFKGTIRSSVGIGILLFEGLGDTIRVSLTGDPVEEVKVAKEILSSLELRRFGIDIVSCPTCGRTEVDLEKLLEEVKEKTKDIKANIRISVMGCIVNGPGEAKDADLGIAGGKGEGIIFEKGEIVGKYREEELVDRFVEKIKEFVEKEEE